MEVYTQVFALVVPFIDDGYDAMQILRTLPLFK